MIAIISKATIQNEDVTVMNTHATNKNHIHETEDRRRLDENDERTQDR